MTDPGPAHHAQIDNNEGVTTTSSNKNCWKRVPLPESEDNCFCYTCYPQETLPPHAVIGMLDMDAFEVQIYLKNILGVEKGRQLYLTTPCILADPSTDRIISVNFLAKVKGISREDRIGSAKEKCPEIHVIRKEVRFCKPENRNLRHSSWSVLDTILKYRREAEWNFAVEYASNDEYFMDLTHAVNQLMLDKDYINELNEDVIGQRTFLEMEEETIESSSIIKIFRSQERREDVLDEFKITLRRLIVGCTILEDIRRYIFDNTNFEASGGISCNKLLTKLACPLHKPGGITILPQQGLFRISANIPIEKLSSLGGERGKMLRDEINEGNPLSIQELATLPFSKMLIKYISLGEMLLLRKLARGQSDNAVVEKLMKMTASVGRANLRGLRFHKTTRIWYVLATLTEELMERLTEEAERHKRIPEQIEIGINYIILPRKEEDREKPPLSQHFAYSRDFEETIWKNDGGKLVDKILTDFLQSVQDEGDDGIIVKISFNIRNFRELL